MRKKNRKTPTYYRGEEITKVSHLTTSTMPPLDYVKFTSASGNVICQRCKVSFPEGVELHFLHDLTGEGPGKNVCQECRQYYITKTEKAGQSTRKSN